jgi:probable HAF family extracellular repeat protein
MSSSSPDFQRIIRGAAPAALIVMTTLVAGCQDMARSTRPSASSPRTDTYITSRGYSALDMGTYARDQQSWANAINDSGYAVGASGNSTTFRRPVLWPKNSSFPVALAFPTGATSGEVFAINHARVMAGYAVKNAFERAIRWRIGFVPLDLGTLGGPDAEARGINAAGTIVGWSHLPNGSLRAFKWTQGGGMVALSTLTHLPGADGAAYGINNNGDIVGESMDALGHQHAVHWTPDGAIHALSTLGGKHSSARAIGADGSIVGFAETSTGVAHAVRWLSGGGMIDYGVPAGQKSSVAMAIALGPQIFVVGFSEGSGYAKAFYNGPQATSLPPLSTFNFDYLATGVRWCGDIVGYGATQLGYTHAVRWTRGGCP